MINAIHGTLYRFICRFTVKVWLCTPPTPHNTRTAPSRTRNALSTSTVKSTWPVRLGEIWKVNTSCISIDDNVHTPYESLVGEHLSKDCISFFNNYSIYANFVKRHHILHLYRWQQSTLWQVICTSYHNISSLFKLGLTIQPGKQNSCKKNCFPHTIIKLETFDFIINFVWSL